MDRPLPGVLRRIGSGGRVSPTRATRFLRTLLPAALAAALAGCGTSPLAVTKQRLDAAHGVVRVRLDLKSSDTVASPGRPLVASAKVANVGSRDVFAGYRCGAVAIDLLVIGPDGGEVRWRSPFWIGLGCPDSFGAFAPGQSVEIPLTFDGQLWTEAGEPFVAAEGVYTVVARFEYSPTPGPPASEHEERALSFYWDLP